MATETQSSEAQGLKQTLIWISVMIVVVAGLAYFAS